MLTHLSIRNIATIEQIDLSLPPALNILTGETGAGKSVLLESLQLLTGARGETSLIRPSCDTAEISAQFDITDNEIAQAWLLERDWLLEDGLLSIRRIISRHGKSKAFIQGQIASTQELRNLGNVLLSINSQFAFQSLLKTQGQLDLFDAFANTKTLRQEVKKAYHAYMQLYHAIETQKKDQAQRQDRLALLTYQLEELKQSAITPQEIEQLEEQYTQLSQIEKYKQTAAEIHHHLKEQTNTNIIGQLTKHQQKLSAVHQDARLQNVSQLIDSAIIQLEEACNELALASEKENDIETAKKIEGKLDQLYQLARKYRLKPTELYTHKETLEQEYQTITTPKEQLLAQEEALKNIKKHYQKLAQELSEKRTRACAQFAQSITQTIQTLGMPHAEFQIEHIVNQIEIPLENGIDDIEFFISTNLGMPIQALQKTASGGELSRICLAIHTITSMNNSQKESTTLVFDEIDAGISGSIAEMVGHLLKQLAKKFQILCVTHLPQIAAQGNAHFFIKKETKGLLTFTQIRQLKNEEKINEIARLLAGIEITQSSKAQAKEMLKYTEQVDT